MALNPLQRRGKSLLFKKTAIAKLSLTDAQKKSVVGAADTDPTTNCESLITTITDPLTRCTTRATHGATSIKNC